MFISRATHKSKYTLLLLIALCIFQLPVFSFGLFKKKSPLVDSNAIRLFFISDINLAPTPISNNVVRKEELESGLLVNESNIVLQEIVEYLNKEDRIDLVVLGGNSISVGNKNQDSIFDYFVDVIGELKHPHLQIYGENERATINTHDLIIQNSDHSEDKLNIWWSKNIGEVLLVGLDGVVFNTSHELSKQQLLWLSKILDQNKNRDTFIFIHYPFIEKPPHQNDFYIRELYKMLKANAQVKLLLSSGDYVSRNIDHVDFVQFINPSPVAYPCRFTELQITPNSFRVISHNIPLKGVLKKAELALYTSKRAKKFPVKSYKQIKKYVEGTRNDANFNYSY